MGYDAVIFDKDGVLLDSMENNYLWADKLRVKMAREKRVELDLDEVREIIRVETSEELEEFSKSTGLSLEDITRMEKKVAREKIKKIKSGEIQLFDQAEKVLETIERPKSLVSNAPWQATKFTVKNFGIEKYFQTVESPELSDIKRYTDIRKPNTYMVEKAIKEMEAENPVMVGDSSDDIKVAENAGIDSIFVNTNGGTDLNPNHQIDELQKVLDII